MERKEVNDCYHSSMAVSRDGEFLIGDVVPGQKIWKEKGKE